MTSAYHDGSSDAFRYDSTNRLIGTNTNAYTYNAENVRIRNLCGEHETTYVYNTNAKLSSMLMKTTDGVVTKYVYGRGLIGEETNGSFKTYHFDYRGSTVAITDINGNVTDRFEYDTYGKLTSRTGSSDVIFLYNGRDGVVTDTNGLIYMRARYYSPELRRFVNADILAGDIANAVTLNRYAYANGNPVSLVDPRGLSPDERNGGNENSTVVTQIIPSVTANSPQIETRTILPPVILIPDEIYYGATVAVTIINTGNEFLINYLTTMISGITKEEHYARNENNMEFPDVLTDEHFDEGGIFYEWSTGVDANCHQFTATEENPNIKIVSPDGHYEVIYDSNNNEVTDPKDVGTYNFVSPIEDKLGHGLKDVLPWIIWGNSEDDKTLRHERFAALFS